MNLFEEDIIAETAVVKDPFQGYMDVDGLLYRDQDELASEGVCGPNDRCHYSFLAGELGLTRMVNVLNSIGKNGAIYAIDFETGPRQLAPVDLETGAFDLSRLSCSISTSTKDSGSEPYTSTVFLMSISTRKDHSYVVDVREMLRLNKEVFLKALGFAATNGKAVGQNLAFECRFIRHMCGVDVQCDFDPMIATHILYAGLPDPDIEWTNPAIKRPRVGASLGAILKREMRITMDKSTRDLFLLMHPECGLTDKQIQYVALDTALLLELRNILVKKLKAKGLDKVWYTIEAPFIPILARISYEGVNVNIERIMELQREAEKEIEELGDIWKTKYPRVPINSPQQILIWAQKKFPAYDVFKADAITLDEINKIEQNTDLTLLLAYRKVYKIDSTYLKPWIVSNRNPITGRIHCEYKQAETDTGRLSCSSPNLQNVAGRGPWAKIRDCFVSLPGNVIIDSDYSQFEVRALADMAGEPGMVEFFRKSQSANSAMTKFLEAHPEIFEAVDADDEAVIDNEEYNALRKEVKANDFHTLNAVALFGDRFTKNNNSKEKGELRSQAKGLSFGIPYGISAIKVSKQFKITKEAAQKLIDEYFKQWPRVKAYLDWCKRQARYQKEVYSVTGRKRFFDVPEAFRGVATAVWKDAYNALWSKAEREASNCLDAETEALTARGWVKGFDLRNDDKVLTKNAETEKLEWQKIEVLHKLPDYVGPIIECKSRNFHSVTTPDHRWLVTKRKNRNCPTQFVTTNQLTGDTPIHRTGVGYIGPDTSEISDDEAELIGWLITDGGLYLHNKKKKQCSYKMSLFQSLRANPVNVKRIDDLLARLNLPNNINKKIVKESQSVIWEIYGITARKFYELLPNRELTLEVIMGLTESGLKRLLEAIQLGDGDKARNRISARSKNHADMIEIVAMLCGYSSKTVYRDMRGYVPKSLGKLQLGNVPKSNGCYRIELLQRKTVQVTPKQMSRTEESATPVWCVTVPNSCFVVRRSGNIYITGNCPIQGINGDVLKMACILMDADLRKYNSRLILLVHDEIVVEAPEEHAKIVNECMEKHMIEAARVCNLLTVPVETSSKIGDHWRH